MPGEPADWTHEQWMEWFDKNLDGVDEWVGSLPEDLMVSMLGQTFEDEAMAWRELLGFGGAAKDAREAFGRLSDEFKARIRDWWNDHREAEGSTNPDPSIDSIADEISPPRPYGYPSEDDFADAQGPDSVPTVEALGTEYADVNESSGEPPIASLDETVEGPAGVEFEEEPVDWGDVDNGGVNITLPNENVARVTPGNGDPEVRIEGLKKEEEEEEEEEEELFGDTPPPIDRGVERTGCLPPTRYMLAAGAAAAVLALGAVIMANLDGETDMAVDDANETTASTASTTAQVDSTATSQPEVAACQAPESDSMTISSPTALNDQLGPDWLTASLRDRGWATPAFEISGVPEGTTELAVVASALSDRELEEYVSNPDTDPSSLHSFYVMLLTGISPSTSLVESFAGTDAPDGVQVHLDALGVLQEDAAFLGLDSDGHMLVTAVALCDPAPDYWNPVNPLWMEGRIADASVLIYVGS